MNISAPKSLKNVATWIVPKAVAVGATSITLYDSHHWGKLKANEKRETKNANAGLKYFENTEYLDNKSHTTSKIKKALFNWELTNRIRGDFNYVTGYLSGACGVLVKDAIPLGLSAAALLLKGKKSLVAAAALGVYGATSFVRRACGHLKEH